MFSEYDGSLYSWARGERPVEYLSDGSTRVGKFSLAGHLEAVDLTREEFEARLAAMRSSAAEYIARIFLRRSN